MLTTFFIFYISILSKEHNQSCNLTESNLFEKLLTIGISPFSLFVGFIITHLFPNCKYFKTEGRFYCHAVLRRDDRPNVFTTKNPKGDLMSPLGLICFVVIMSEHICRSSKVYFQSSTSSSIPTFFARNTGVLPSLRCDS